MRSGGGSAKNHAAERRDAGGEIALEAFEYRRRDAQLGAGTEHHDRRGRAALPRSAELERDRAAHRVPAQHRGAIRAQSKLALDGIGKGGDRDGPSACAAR